MAKIIGGIATAHVPAIGLAIARGLQQDPYWKPLFDGYKTVHEWLARMKPDVVVLIYNDHGLNFFLDKMPTFAVGAANLYRNADEGWGLPVARSFSGDTALSWHLVESLVADEFDVTTCQQMLVDHAFVVPMQLLWPGGGEWPVRTVPVSINAVQHPLPSPGRCLKLGRAIERYPEDMRVLVVGVGGPSHQLDRERAGFINKEFDLGCFEKLVHDPEALIGYSAQELVERAGTRGAELLMWIAMRGALTGVVSKAHGNDHIPISNAAAGLLVLDHEKGAVPSLRRELATVFGHP